MEEYINSFRTFHRENMLSMSNKKKYSHCPGCDNPKICTMKQDGMHTILTMSCGSSSGKCGEQFSIKIPNYIHYINEIDTLSKQLNNGYDYDILSNYIDVSDLKKDYNEKQTLLQTTLDSIEEKYSKVNSIEQLKMDINKELKQYNLLSDKAAVLLYKINETKDNTLCKEYVKQKILMKQTLSTIHKLIHSISPYLEITKPKITQSATSVVKQTKKPTTFIVGDKVEWKSGSQSLQGTIIKLSGKKRAVIEEFSTNEIYNIVRKQLKKIDIFTIPVPEVDPSKGDAAKGDAADAAEGDAADDAADDAAEGDAAEGDAAEEEDIIDPNVKRIQLEKPQNSWDVQVRNIQRGEIQEQLLRSMNSTPDDYYTRLLAYFVDNDILTKQTYEQQYSNHSNAINWGDDLFKLLQLKDTMSPWYESQLKLKSSIIEKPKKNANSIKITSVWKQVLSEIKGKLDDSIMANEEPEAIEEEPGAIEEEPEAIEEEPEVKEEESEAKEEEPEAKEEEPEAKEEEPEVKEEEPEAIEEEEELSDNEDDGVPLTKDNVQIGARVKWSQGEKKLIGNVQKSTKKKVYILSDEGDVFKLPYDNILLLS
jgi:hypothetical protein